MIKKNLTKAVHKKLRYLWLIENGYIVPQSYCDKCKSKPSYYINDGYIDTWLCKKHYKTNIKDAIKEGQKALKKLLKEKEFIIKQKLGEVRAKIKQYKEFTYKIIIDKRK